MAGVYTGFESGQNKRNFGYALLKSSVSKPILCTGAQPDADAAAFCNFVRDTMRSFKFIVAENPFVVLAAAGDYSNIFTGMSPVFGEN